MDELLADVQRAFVSRCDRDLDVLIPGYTHLQRAMPVSAAHSWLCWVEKLRRDRARLADCRERLNECPLGAAALAGTSLPIDRDRTAELLGFDRPAANSLDVSSDRDFLAEYLFCLSLCAVHLSQWAEEWVVWFSTEFGFLSLPDAYTTGSSIMPQKRNPDVPELIRGRTGRAVGALVQVLTLLKGLPTAYNRDLQEDKLALFAAHDSVVACLDLMPPVVAGAELNRGRIAARLDDGFLDATALMEYAIKAGVPMRSAHHAVGSLVALCEKSGRRLAELSDEEFAAADPRIDPGVRGVLGAANAAAALKSYRRRRAGAKSPSRPRRGGIGWGCRCTLPARSASSGRAARTRASSAVPPPRLAALVGRSSRSGLVYCSSPRDRQRLPDAQLAALTDY